jgi:hypothetical protein
MGRFFLTGTLAVCFSMATAFAADKPTVEDPEALLQRVRSHATEHLAQLPNYTCREVVDRLVRSGSNWQHLDTVELEVAYVGQQEIFSRPGEAFAEQSVDKVVSGGTIGNGAFGSHIDVIFSGDVAEFKYVGTAKKDGHQTYRFDLRVPQEKSRFLVRHRSAQGMAGYQGSVWVDTETLDVVRVDFKVNRIPPHIGVRLIEESLHYKKMRIGNNDFLLPRNSELAATDDLGNHSLNMIGLDNCREYTGQSVVKYGPPKEGSASRDRQDK